MRRWVSHFRQAVVIERTTGERLGTALRFLVDRSARAVGGVLLSEPSADRPGLLVPLGAIASFGDHALMVEGRPIEVTPVGLDEWPGGHLSARYPVGLPLLTPGHDMAAGAAPPILGGSPPLPPPPCPSTSPTATPA